MCGVVCVHNFIRIISLLIFTLLLFLFCFNKCSLAGRSTKMVFADKWRTPTIAKCRRFSKSFGSAELLHSNFGCWSTAQCHCWYTIADTPLLIHLLTVISVSSPLLPYLPSFPSYHFTLLTPLPSFPFFPYFPLPFPPIFHFSHMLLITLILSHQIIFHSRCLMWNSLRSTFQQVFPHRLQHLIWGRD